MRSLPLICLLLSAAPAPAAEQAVWSREDGLTSATLAQGVLGAKAGAYGAQWGLLSASAILLPDGSRVITFWRWTRLTGGAEGEDAIYRCTDELDSAGMIQRAWCEVSRVEDR